MKKSVVVLLLFVFWISSSWAVDKKEVLKVALIHTFSKADPLCYDPYGKNMLNGIAMAWSDFSAKHPSLPFTIEFDKYDLADNKLNSGKLIEEAKRNGAIAAIGYICSDFALLGGREAQKLHIPMITPTASDDGLADLDEYVFTFAPINSYQGDALASFVADSLKLRKTLIISAADCSYCISLANGYSKSFKKNGGDIVDEIRILTNDKSFTTIVEQMSGKTFDSVLIADYAMQSAGIIAELVKNGIEAVFLGGDSWIWKENAFDVVGNKSFIGYSVIPWMPEFPLKASKEFIKKYEILYHESPIDTSVHSYDAAMFLFNAMLKVDKFTSENLKTALHQIKVYNGITGRQEFGNQNWPRRSLIIMKSTNKKQELYKLTNIR